MGSLPPINPGELSFLKRTREEGGIKIVVAVLRSAWRWDRFYWATENSQTHTQEGWGRAGCALSWTCTSNPETQHVYYIQMIEEVGLLYQSNE